MRRQGRNYVGLCPWHDDTRPSLQVNPERQSFKCWVCDIGGDVFSFVMKMEGVEFREALAMLAERAGIALDSRRDSQPATAPPAAAHDKRTLYQAMAWAEEQYHECLLESPEAEPARRYLAERRITAESIEKFHLGFSPRIGGLDSAPRAERHGRTAPRCSRRSACWSGPRPAAGLYDRFRAGVLFSIRDAQGRPVGLGGRVLPESGLDQPGQVRQLARNAAVLQEQAALRPRPGPRRDPQERHGAGHGRLHRLIVAHQYGFDNAVAVLGTALGEGHIRILKRFADRIVLVLDGDEAGQTPGQRGAGTVRRPAGRPARSSPCPRGSTRATSCRSTAPRPSRELLEPARRSTPWSTPSEAATRGSTWSATSTASSQALERLVAIVAKAPRLRPTRRREHRFREEKILQRLAVRVPRADEARRAPAADGSCGARSRPRARPATAGRRGAVPTDARPPAAARADRSAASGSCWSC